MEGPTGPKKRQRIEVCDQRLMNAAALTPDSEARVEHQQLTCLVCNNGGLRSALSKCGRSYTPVRLALAQKPKKGGAGRDDISSCCGCCVCDHCKRRVDKHQASLLSVSMDMDGGGGDGAYDDVYDDAGDPSFGDTSGRASSQVQFLPDGSEDKLITVKASAASKILRRIAFQRSDTTDFFFCREGANVYRVPRLSTKEGDVTITDDNQLSDDQDIIINGNTCHSLLCCTVCPTDGTDELICVCNCRGEDPKTTRMLQLVFDRAQTQTYVSFRRDADAIMNGISLTCIHTATMTEIYKDLGKLPGSGVDVDAKRCRLATAYAPMQKRIARWASDCDENQLEVDRHARAIDMLMLGLYDEDDDIVGAVHCQFRFEPVAPVPPNAIPGCIIQSMVPEVFCVDPYTYSVKLGVDAESAYPSRSFSAAVYVSQRNAVTCATCHRGNCDHCQIVRNIVKEQRNMFVEADAANGDNDEADHDYTKPADRPASTAPRMASFLFGQRDDRGLVCPPCHFAPAARDHFLRTKCACGCEPAEMDKTWGKAVLFREKDAIELDIEEGRCPRCNDGMLHVNDGLEDGYVNMGRHGKNSGPRPYILISNDIFVSVTHGLGDISGFTLTSIWVILESQYAFHRKEGSPAMALFRLYLKKSQFIRFVWSYFEYLVVPYLHGVCNSCDICPHCGPNLKTVGFDGNAMGLLLRVNKLQLAIEYFNLQQVQKSFPPNVFKEVYRWSEMCLCDKHVSDSLSWFIAGHKSKKAQYLMADLTGTVATITGDDDHAALDDDGAQAILFVLNDLLDNHFVDTADTSPVQLPVSLRPLMSVVAARSVIPVFGEKCTVVAWCNIVLSLGGSAAEYIPKCLAHVLSPSALEDLSTVAILIDEEDIAQCEANISSLFERRALPEDDNGEAMVYVNAKIEGVADELKRHILRQLPRNQSLFESLNMPPAEFVHERERHNIIAVMRNVFPQLADYVCEHGPRACNFELEPPLRPIFSVLAQKAVSLWLHDRVFLEGPAQANAKGRFFTEATSQSVPPARRHTVASLRARMNADSTGVADKEKCRVLLVAIAGSSRVVEIDLRSDAQSGCHFSEHMRRTREYRTPYVSDHIHNNNSSRRNDSSYRPPKSAREGCDKNFPVNEKFTSGIMIMTCGCSDRVIYGVCFMDSAESVSMPFDMMMQRFTIAPQYVFYDNACHLHYYCVSREPAFFWNTTFVVDRFHEHNHTACSKTYMCSVHAFDEELLRTNTQAVEQVNSSFRKSMESNLRFMNMRNALSYLAVYIALYNTRKWRKARLASLYGGGV